MLMMMNSVFIERTERNSLEGPSVNVVAVLSTVGILMLFQAAQGDDNPEMCEMLAGANEASQPRGRLPPCVIHLDFTHLFE